MDNLSTQVALLSKEALVSIFNDMFIKFGVELTSFISTHPEFIAHISTTETLPVVDDDILHNHRRKRAHKQKVFDMSQLVLEIYFFTLSCFERVFFH